MFPLYCQSFTLSEGWGAYSILLRRDERTKRLYYTHQRSALLSLPVSLVVLVSKTCLLLFEFYPFLRHFLLKQFQTLTFKGPNILNQYFRTQKFGTLMNSCCLSLVFKSAWAHVLLIYTQYTSTPLGSIYQYISLRRLLHYSLRVLLKHHTCFALLVLVAECGSNQSTLNLRTRIHKSGLVDLGGRIIVCVCASVI